MESVAIVVDRIKEADAKVSVWKSYSLKEDTKRKCDKIQRSMLLWSDRRVLVVCIWISILEESPFHALKVYCGARLRSGFKQHRDPRGSNLSGLLLIDNTCLEEDNKTLERNAMI
jgi:hypothetical protein